MSPSAAVPGAPKLQASMGLGALYDLLLGIALITALEPLSRIIPVALPQQPFYARTVGVLLVALAIFYSFPACSLIRHARNVAGAITARTIGGFYIGLYPLFDTSVSWFFIVFGALDLMWAGVHLGFMYSEHFARFWPLLLRGEIRLAQG